MSTLSHTIDTGSILPVSPAVPGTPQDSPIATLATAIRAIASAAQNKQELLSQAGKLLCAQGAFGLVHWVKSPSQELSVYYSCDSVGHPLEPQLLSKIAIMARESMASGVIHCRSLASRFKIAIVAVPLQGSSNDSELLSVCYNLGANSQDQEETLRPVSSQHVEAFTTDAEIVASQVAIWNLKHQHHSDSSQSAGKTTATKAITDALDCDNLNESLSILGQFLMRLVDCKGVAFALRGSRDRVQLLSNEGVLGTQQDPETRRRIEDALRQSVLLDKRLTVSPDQKDEDAISCLLRSIAPDDRYCTIMCEPLRTDSDQVVGAWLLVGDDDQDTASLKSEPLEAVRPMIAICLASLMRIHQTLPQHAMSAMRSRIAKKSQLIWAGLAALAIGILCIPYPYRIWCNCTCEPINRRFVAAPFEGRLLESKVRPGAQVKQGDVLAVMEGNELRAQIAGLGAKLGQARQRYDAALSSGKASEAFKEQMEIRHLNNQMEILQLREKNREIRSPIDGVIVAGDLEQIQGVPLTLGQNLFEIAPLTSLVAEIEIPEGEISHVDRQEVVTIQFASVPGSRFFGTIERIHPRAETREDSNVFIAEAEFSDLPEFLLPGMSGQARVEGGSHSVGWILFHRPWNALRRMMGQ